MPQRNVIQEYRHCDKKLARSRAFPTRELSVRLFVRPFVRLSVAKMHIHKNAIWSCLYRPPIGSPTWAFQRTYYWTPKIQDGGHPPSSKSSNRHISTKKTSDFDAIWYTNADLELGDSHVTK